MAWLTVRTNDGADWLTREDVLDFKLDGETRRLQPTQQGIWKPRDLPAALSFQTVYRAPGKERPYNDEPGPDGMLRYAWRGDDPDQADNRALRAAMELQKPLIWFYGVGSVYVNPSWPRVDGYLWPHQESRGLFRQRARWRSNPSGQVEVFPT
jgi:putative restriction endonuclease